MEEIKFLIIFIAIPALKMIAGAMVGAVVIWWLKTAITFALGRSVSRFEQVVWIAISIVAVAIFCLAATIFGLWFLGPW